MKEKDFIKILSKTLDKKISKKSSLELDSLDILRIVEMNNMHFKKLKINGAKIIECKTFSELRKIYGKEIN